MFDMLRTPNIEGAGLSPTQRLLLDYRDANLFAGILSHETARCYLWAVRPFLRWLDENALMVEQVDYRVIERYRVHLTITPMSTPRGGRKRSPSTIHHVLRAIKHFAKWLIIVGKLKKNPFDRVSLSRPADRTMIPLKDWELKKLIEAAKSNGRTPLDSARNYALITLISDLGLRIQSEALALNISDVQKNGRLVNEFMVSAKGANRLVPLAGMPAQAIDEYLSLRQDTHQALFVTSPYRINRPLGRLSYQAAYQMLKILGEKLELDLKRVTWHNLRRTSATLSLLDGEDLFTIMAIFGWRRVATVQRYVGFGAKQESVETHRNRSLVSKLLANDDSLEMSNSPSKRSTAQHRFMSTVHDGWKNVRID
jgi:site-specific recombinase XerD